MRKFAKRRFKIYESGGSGTFHRWKTSDKTNDPTFSRFCHKVMRRNKWFSLDVYLLESSTPISSTPFWSSSFKFEGRTERKESKGKWDLLEDLYECPSRDSFSNVNETNVFRNETDDLQSHSSIIITDIWPFVLLLI